MTLVERVSSSFGLFIAKETRMNIEYFTEASLAIQIHILVAVGAFFLGGTILVMRKGTPGHKMAGRMFGALMIVTAITAIFIRQINNGNFSFIHIFVPITFIGMYQIVSSIRKGEVKRHKKHVRNMYFGALMIPGLLAFLPGRTMWMMFFA